MDLSLQIEKLPESACKLHVKVGSKANRLTNVRSFDYLAPEEEILDCLEEYGYGSEYGYARLIWYDSKSKQVKSYSISEKLKEEEESSTIKVLVDGLLDMAAEQRRFVSTMNSTVESLTGALTQSREKNLELQEQVVEERSTTLALDLALQDAEKEGELNYKERALETISQGIQAYVANKTAMTPAGLKNLMLEHPGLIDELVKDEEVVNLISQRIMSSKLTKEEV
jgi:hypothetical protein